jgi:hypothetical protein
MAVNKIYATFDDSVAIEVRVRLAKLDFLFFSEKLTVKF